MSSNCRSNLIQKDLKKYAEIFHRKLSQCDVNQSELKDNLKKIACVQGINEITKCQDKIAISASVTSPSKPGGPQPQYLFNPSESSTDLKK